MPNWIRRRPFLAAGVLLTPIALVVGFISSGAGHGTYVAARIALPFACLGMGEYLGAAWIVSILAVLQWPIYGALVDRASHKVLSASIILTMHTALSALLFTHSSALFN
jgi:hypothetical protein